MKRKSDGIVNSSKDLQPKNEEEESENSDDMVLFLTSSIRVPTAEVSIIYVNSIVPQDKKNYPRKN
jgi:hypothetical protein